MTESEWNSAPDPQPLLEALRAAGAVSERKLRLWCCACCRRRWDEFDEHRSRIAVEMAERYADGLVSEAERATVEQAAEYARSNQGDHVHATDAAWLLCRVPVELETVELAATDMALNAAVGHRDGIVHENVYEAAWGRERGAQTALLRHLVGNPFRPMTLPAQWPQAIHGLAEAVYRGDNVAFALSDALCECGFGEFAEHFRQPDHPKGCAWLDAILGKS